LVLVKWSGTLEDGKGIDLPETYQILLGPEKANSPFASVVKALYGKKVGDVFQEKVHFSKDEKVPDLAGKKAEIKVEVQKVEEPVTFKLDDEFAKEFNVATLEELRQSVRSSVEHEGKKVAHLYTKRHLLDALDAQYSFDLPPTMVENEFKTIWAQLQRELAEARASGDLDEEDEKKSEEELKADYEAIAKRRVRLGLLISHLADVHKLKLSDEEVRMAVFQEAMRYPNQSDEVIKYYVNNNQALRNLVAPLLEDKVVDFILANSNVTERKVDFPTLKKVVRGVIPTPYDDEMDDTEEDQMASKAASSKEKKSTKAKGKGA
jgi:trigger factor